MRLLLMTMARSYCVHTFAAVLFITGLRLEQFLEVGDSLPLGLSLAARR